MLAAVVAIATSALAGAIAAAAPAPVVSMLCALALGAALSTAAALAGLGRAAVVVAGSVFAIVFATVYVLVLSPIYAYSGLIDAVDGPATVAVAVLFALAPLIAMPIAVTRPSQIVLWALYTLAYVPGSIVPLFVLGPSLARVLPLNVSIALGFAALLLGDRLPRPTVGWQGLSWRRFERLAIGAGVASLVFLFAFFGLPTGLPDFTAVYDARAEFVAAQSSIPFSGYLVAWAGNVVFTLLIGLGLSRRRLVPLLVGVGGELAIYSLQGAKSVLFLVVIAPTVVALVRRGRRWFGAWLLWGATVAVGVAAAITAFTDNPWPLALTVVRPLALPAQLLAYYFDFFTTHEPYLLSHSILRPFVAPAYPVDPPFLIGGLYLHTYVDANANLWADAMANFGLLAIVPVSLILGAVLWILDVAARRADLAPLAPVLAIVALTLANGGLLTALLTNGIGLAIVVAALLPGVEEPTAPTFAVGRPDAAPTAIPPTRLDWPPPLPP